MPIQEASVAGIDCVISTRGQIPQSTWRKGRGGNGEAKMIWEGNHLLFMSNIFRISSASSLLNTLPGSTSLSSLGDTLAGFFSTAATAACCTRGGLSLPSP